MLVTYHFPVDAQYVFRVKLARNYTDTLAPICESHDLALTLDGEQLKLFSIVPTGGRAARADVDAHFEARLPVKAGPPQVVATFVRNSVDPLTFLFCGMTTRRVGNPDRPKIGGKTGAHWKGRCAKSWAPTCSLGHCF